MMQEIKILTHNQIKTHIYQSNTSFNYYFHKNNPQEFFFTKKKNPPNIFACVFPMQL